MTGDVQTVSYAGVRLHDVLWLSPVLHIGQPNAEVLLAAGLLTVSGSQAYLASYTPQNQSWAAVGSLPGPITALEVDDRNQSSVFAAGKTSDGVFMSHWDGSQWTSIGMS